MNFVRSTTMSYKRIVLSFLIFLLVPVLRWILTPIAGSETLALTFALNFTAWLLIIYDWELFGLHWNRAKENLPDVILYVVLGFVVLFFWTLINTRYLKGSLTLPDPSVFRTDPIAGPAVQFAYSLSLGIIINIEFKCLTDHMKIHAREATMILVTGFLFGLLYTLIFPPANLSQIPSTYLYYIVMFSLFSYLYNQTHTILPGILCYTAVYLCWMIFFVA